VIAGAENFAPPKWRVAFPFVDMVSTFVGDKPEVDFLKDNPTIPRSSPMRRGRTSANSTIA